MVYDLPRPSPMSHCKHFPSSSSSYSPSTKSADISRLLDPSYASTSTTSYPAVYVDHDGEVHDPDYRQFPSPSSFDASRRNGQRRIRGGQRDHRRWASDDDFESETESDDEQDDDEEIYPRRRSLEVTRRPSSPRHQHQQRRHSRNLSPLPLSLPTLSTSPSSFDSSETWLSTVADRDELFLSSFDSAPQHDRERVLRKKRAPQPSPQSPTKKCILFGTQSPLQSPSYLPSTFSSSSSDLPDDLDESLSLDRPMSPSKSEALKKEWSAISLSFNIGLFRMKKRVKGVVRRT